MEFSLFSVRLSSSSHSIICVSVILSIPLSLCLTLFTVFFFLSVCLKKCFQWQAGRFLRPCARRGCLSSLGQHQAPSGSHMERAGRLEEPIWISPLLSPQARLFASHFNAVSSNYLETDWQQGPGEPPLCPQKAPATGSACRCL